MTIPGFDGVLVAAQEGSEWAWGILVRDVGPTLVGFFRTRGVADPEGLASDVFVALARSLHEFSGDESGFRSWVFVIAYRRMADEWRRHQRRPLEELIGAVSDAAGVSESAETVAMETFGNVEVARLLGVLTADQRDVIGLRVVVGLTLGETAQVVGKPIGAVKALQRRGIAALRREIDHQGVSL